jgi:6,7-dimethyl-8-ribityllumazine synthase
MPPHPSTTTFEECSMTTATPTRTQPRIAYIEAQWHSDIVHQARAAFTEELAANAVPADAIDLFEVPGSLEIPLQAKLLAETNRYDIIIAAGLVVDGGIYRHDFVASAVIDGMMRVQLDTRVPILSVVLTPQHFHEHSDHHDFFLNHFLVKGREAARACLRTLANQTRLAQLASA